MCHYITGVIDKAADLEALNAVGRSHQITFGIRANPHMARVLKPNEQYLFKHTKYCDCGTDLGWMNRQQSGSGLRIEKREVDNLRAKGWSENKIQRWIADKEKTIAKIETERLALLHGYHSDAENWQMYLRNAFNTTDIKYLGIMLHWYSGGVDSERITLKDRRRITLVDLSEEILLQFEEDVIYDIVRFSK